MKSFCNLNNKNYKYFLGLAMSDGHLRSATRNRGCLEIELNKRDQNILDKLERLIPANVSRSKRTRITNFSTSSSVCSIRVFDIKFRRLINAHGMPYGKKSYTLIIPNKLANDIDFWRGFVDGDGSLGKAKSTTRKCFLALTTKSEDVATKYLKFLAKKFGIYKTSRRNKRDGVYNITLLGCAAQKVAKTLYYKGCLGIDRKRSAAKTICNMNLPQTAGSRRWTKAEDEYLLKNGLAKSMKKLSRSEQAVKCRLFRLGNGIKSHVEIDNY
jgi:hypothetical protein